VSGSLLTAVQRGRRLSSLEALRDYLAEALDQTVSARDQASLSARLMDCLEQIEALAPPTEEVDPLDDFFDDGDEDL
jgi:hypothetical protein